MTARDVIVVDVETNGLDVERHQAVEVAWWHLGTGERGRFVPWHHVSEVLGNADVEALRINLYLDRLADEPQDLFGRAAKELAKHLDGHTLAAANPAFDSKFLRKMFRSYEGLAPSWHHRMLDLSAYAAGVLGIPPTELPGLATVCEALDVTNPAPHTAEGDVTATGQCFLKLFALNASRLPS